MKLPAASLVMLALIVAGCGAPPPALEPGPHLTVTQDRDLPPPTGSEGIATARAYRVAPFDELKINVFGIEELNQTVHADAQGNVSLPLIGTVAGGGLTLQELSQQVANRLRRYVRDPQVSVNLEETTSLNVTVYGQVTEPGQFPIVGQTTLLRSIARAKGATDVADVADVVVYRTVNNQNMAALYNLEAIRRGTYPDPAIYANDVIVVGDSPGRRLFKDILQASPLLVTPIVVLLQRL